MQKYRLVVSIKDFVTFRSKTTKHERNRKRNDGQRKQRMAACRCWKEDHGDASGMSRPCVALIGCSISRPCNFLFSDQSCSISDSGHFRWPVEIRVTATRSQRVGQLGAIFYFAVGCFGKIVLARFIPVGYIIFRFSWLM